MCHKSTTVRSHHLNRWEIFISAVLSCVARSAPEEVNCGKHLYLKPSAFTHRPANR